MQIFHCKKNTSNANFWALLVCYSQHDVRYKAIQSMT